jgi:hypothetical protein
VISLLKVRFSGFIDWHETDKTPESPIKAGFNLLTSTAFQIAFSTCRLYVIVDIAVHHTWDHQEFFILTGVCTYTVMTYALGVIFSQPNTISRNLKN